jgi:hypothetical protein
VSDKEGGEGEFRKAKEGVCGLSGQRGFEIVNPAIWSDGIGGWGWGGLNGTSVWRGGCLWGLGGVRAEAGCRGGRVRVIGGWGGCFDEWYTESANAGLNRGLLG